MMWNYNDWWQMGMGYGFHWIFMVAFWGLLIWGAYALFRWAANYAITMLTISLPHRVSFHGRLPSHN